MKNKVLYFTMLLLLFASCTKQEQHFIIEDLKEWFVDNGNRDFEVCDENGIHQTFHFHDVEKSFVTGFYGLTFFEKEYPQNEENCQNGNGFFEDSNCRLHFTAYSEATHVFFEFYGAQFVFNYNDSGDIESEDGLKCSDGYDYLLYGYTIERLDSYEVDGKTYRDVIHIKVVDPDCITRPTFPTEIYYAKHYGPIRYQLARQHWLHRVAE